MSKLTLDVIFSYDIKYMLEHESYQEGDKLPSERELCERFGCQRLTIRSALRILMHEGVIEVRERQGYFVAPSRVEKRLNQFESTSKQLENNDLDNESIIIDFAETVVDKSMVQPFGECIGTPIYRIKRLRKIRGIPTILELSYVLQEYAPNLIREDLEENSLYQVLEDSYQIVMTRAEKTLTVIHADEEMAHHLQVPVEHPLGDQHGKVFDRYGRKIEFSQAIFLMDRFVFVR